MVFFFPLVLYVFFVLLIKTAFDVKYRNLSNNGLFLSYLTISAMKGSAYIYTHMHIYTYHIHTLPESLCQLLNRNLRLFLDLTSSASTSD